MAACVFDSAAVLAAAYGEPGAALVQSRLPHALISSVNLCECLSSMIAKGRTPDAAWKQLRQLQLEVIGFDFLQARAAAALIEQTRSFGLSLGDRACLALARARRLPVLTADRIWAELHLGIEVQLIR